MQTVISYQAIRHRISSLAEQVALEIPQDKPIQFFVVLKGAFFFAADFIRAHEKFEDAKISFIRLKSYVGDKPLQYPEIEWVSDNPLPDHAIVVLEDILDTGQTYHAISEWMLKHNINEWKFVPLFVKVSAPNFPCLYGFTVPDEFLIGYGLDYNDKFRALKGVFAHDCAIS